MRESVERDGVVLEGLGDHYADVLIQTQRTGSGVRVEPRRRRPSSRAAVKADEEGAAEPPVARLAPYRDLVDRP